MNRAPGAQLAYVMFLHNAEYFLAWFEKKQIPFIIMLYPGGAFRLDDSDSDAKLRAVFSSTLFRKVIVSQKITQDYLVQKGFCSLNDIKLIYGVITPTEQIKASRLPRKLYKKDKHTFDVCFVAMKYTIQGIDKGYDLFIALAKKLCLMFDDIRFHVVGTFFSEDIDVSEISDKIFFYGPRPRGFFVEFYAGMDAILSANRPFILDSGAFDGFPTTACVEAGLSGVAVFCSD